MLIGSASSLKWTEEQLIKWTADLSCFLAADLSLEQVSVMFIAIPTLPHLFLHFSKKNCTFLLILSFWQRSQRFIFPWFSRKMRDNEDVILAEGFTTSLEEIPIAFGPCKAIRKPRKGMKLLWTYVTIDLKKCFSLWNRT